MLKEKSVDFLAKPIYHWADWWVRLLGPDLLLARRIFVIIEATSPTTIHQYLPQEHLQAMEQEGESPHTGLRRPSLPAVRVDWFRDRQISSGPIIFTLSPGLWLGGGWRLIKKEEKWENNNEPTTIPFAPFLLLLDVPLSGQSPCPSYYHRSSSGTAGPKATPGPTE